MQTWKMMKKTNKDMNATENKKDALRWTEEMDEVLIDALLEQEENGNRVDGTFTSTAYSNVVKKCTEKIGYPFDKDHIKNRMKTLKLNFNTCYDLFKNLSGFSWSPETKLFEAEPEVWKALIEAKPSASKWRHTKIKFYKKLYDLFAKDRANGDGAVSAKEKVQGWARDGSSNQANKNSNNNENNSPMSASSQPNSEAVTSSRGTKRKESVINLFEKECEVIGGGINKVAEAIEKGNLVAERGLAIAEKRIAISERARPRYYSEDEVFAELLNIGVPEKLQLDALVFLIKSQTYKSAFFAVPSERRKDLLYKMMDDATNP